MLVNVVPTEQMGSPLQGEVEGWLTIQCPLQSAQQIFRRWYLQIFARAIVRKGLWCSDAGLEVLMVVT